MHIYMSYDISVFLRYMKFHAFKSKNDIYAVLMSSSTSKW